MTTIVSFEDWSHKKRRELESDEDCRIECDNCDGTGVEIATDCECPNCDGHEVDCDVCDMEGTVRFSDADDYAQEKLLMELYQRAVFDDLKALSDWTSDWQLLANKGYHLYSRFMPGRLTQHRDQMCYCPNEEPFIVRRYCH